MRIALSEVKGLAQRMQMLQTQEDPDYANSSVCLQRDTPALPAAPAVPQVDSETPCIEHEMLNKSQRVFKSIDDNLSGLRKLRQQRLKMIIDERKRLEAIKERERAEAARKEQERLDKIREKQEKEEADRKRREEEELKEKQKQQEEAERAQQTKAAQEKADREAKAKAAQEAKARAEKQAKEKAAEEAKAAQEAAAAKAQTAGLVAATEEYAGHMKVIEHAKKILNPQVSADKELKNQCYEMKITMKSRLGQLTASRSHIMDILEQLRQLFRRAKALGDLGYHWVCNQYAKILVQQAASESCVDGSAALPIAMLTVLLWADFPDLGPYLLARFVKRDPYVIGYTCSIDTEQGRKRMGYRRDDDGVWESDTAYGERISGITSVWAVMTQSKMSVKNGLKHPLPITNSWKFLARQLNTPTDKLYNANFCAVAAWWDVAGTRFLDAFAKQAVKLLQCASDDWTQSVESQTFAAAKRLRLLGQDWARSGEIKPVWKPLGP